MIHSKVTQTPKKQRLFLHCNRWLEFLFESTFCIFFLSLLVSPFLLSILYILWLGCSECAYAHIWCIKPITTYYTYVQYFLVTQSISFIHKLVHPMLFLLRILGNYELNCRLILFFYCQNISFFLHTILTGKYRHTQIHNIYFVEQLLNTTNCSLLLLLLLEMRSFTIFSFVVSSMIIH